MGIRRQGVDDLAGLGVVELFARFMLDGVGAVLEAVYVIAQVRIFLLQIFDFVLELLFLVALLIPRGQAVVAIDHAPRKEEREGCGKERAGRTPAMLRPFDGALTKWKRLIGRFLVFTEQI